MNEKLLDFIYRSPSPYHAVENCAQTLIADGVPIEAAALQSGFNDPKYFARMSKKYLHRTPSELKDYV